MPIYEYRCNACQRKFSALVGVVASSRLPACPQGCGTDLSRLMSRFSSPRADDSILEGLGDPTRLESMDDPAEMRRWMRQASREMGEEGDDLEDLMEEAIQEEATDIDGYSDQSESHQDTAAPQM